MYHPIDAYELLNRLKNGEKLNLLDVRKEIEYHTYNVGGKNIALSGFLENINKTGHNKTDEIIVICHAGFRSDTAVKMLNENGYQNARNLTGGLLAIQKLRQKNI